MKTPEECMSIQDIRDAVNEHDRRIIAILGERTKYVREAVRFKKTEVEIRTPGRKWAEEQELDADFVEQIYRILVSHSFERIGKSIRPWLYAAAIFAHSPAPRPWFDGAQRPLMSCHGPYW